MGDAAASLVQPRQQHPGVGIAQINLLPRRRPQARQHVPGDPARAIAAPREPERIEPGIIGDFKERPRARVIGPGEMAMGQKALWMHEKLQPVGAVKAGGKPCQRRRSLRLNPHASGDNSDPEWLLGHDVRCGLLVMCGASF